MKNKKEVIVLLKEMSGKKRIGETMRLRTDLGFDSLEMVRLMIAFEERFGVVLTESDMDPTMFGTVGDMIALAEKYNRTFE